MKSLPVILSDRATRQLAELQAYVEANSGSARARSLVDAIIDYCGSLATFPERGTRRDDISHGLRTIGYRRRATIAFTIERREAIVIQGIFYGGQDYEAAFTEEEE